MSDTDGMQHRVIPLANGMKINFHGSDESFRQLFGDDPNDPDVQRFWSSVGDDLRTHEEE